MPKWLLWQSTCIDIRPGSRPPIAPSPTALISVVSLVAWQFLPGEGGGVPTPTGIGTHFKCVASPGRCRSIQGQGGGRGCGRGSGRAFKEVPAELMPELLPELLPGGCPASPLLCNRLFQYLGIPSGTLPIRRVLPILKRNQREPQGSTVSPAKGEQQPLDSIPRPHLDN